jgi:hypothetical protein
VVTVVVHDLLVGVGRTSLMLFEVIRVSLVQGVEVAEVERV